MCTLSLDRGVFVLAGSLCLRRTVRIVDLNLDVQDRPWEILRLHSVSCRFYVQFGRMV